MLMLDRRQGEVIRIGDMIAIKVITLNGRQVKLGFDVPDEIPVYREEVYQRILSETNSTTILGQRKSKTNNKNKKVRANVANV